MVGSFGELFDQVMAARDLTAQPECVASMATSRYGPFGLPTLLGQMGLIGLADRADLGQGGGEQPAVGIGCRCRS